MQTNAFQFDNYLDYLKVGCEQHLSRRGRAVTLRDLAKRLGYRSPRSIGMILTGKRIPSPDMVQRISSVFSHSHSEHRYFELLVQLEKYQRQKKDPKLILAQLRELNPKTRNIVLLDADAFKYIAEWYHLVIKQLVESPDFKEDIDWIRRRLRRKLTASEIRTAIQTMLRIGILARTSTGNLISTDKHFSTVSDIANIAARHHHTQMLDRAKEAVTEQDVSRREFDSKTMRIDPRQIAKAKQFLRTCRDEFIERFASVDARDVYQLNFQLFSHTDKE